MRRVIALFLGFCLASLAGVAFAAPMAELEYAKFDSNGNVKVADAGVSSQVPEKNVNVGIVTNSVIWTPPTGKKAVITDMVISTNAVNTVTLKHGSTTFLGPLYFAANGGLSSNLKTPVKGAADETITITTTAGNTSVTLNGREE